MLTKKIKGFLKMSGHYSGSAIYLAEHGYDDTYIDMLNKERETASGDAKNAQGKALYAQALLFRGQLRAALPEFEGTDVSKLPREMKSVFANNYILCLFLLEKPRQIRQVYTDLNKEALSENSLVMRRTIGIREHIEKRYENAVTVFVKLLSQPDPRVTLMADICIVKSMLALDMRDRAAEIAQLGFSRYNGRREITTIVNKLNMRIKSGR